MPTPDSLICGLSSPDDALRATSSGTRGKDVAVVGPDRKMHPAVEEKATSESSHGLSATVWLFSLAAFFMYVGGLGRLIRACPALAAAALQVYLTDTV